MSRKKAKFEQVSDRRVRIGQDSADPQLVIDGIDVEAIVEGREKLDPRATDALLIAIAQRLGLI